MTGSSGASAGSGLGRTLIIIPAFNEEESLPRVLGALHRAGWRDILVVDDGSSDRTADVAVAAGALVARLPYNLGVGGAMRTGFRFAARNEFVRTVQFDADGQHQVEYIATLLAQLDSGADLVIGSRFATRERAYPTGVVRGGAFGVLRHVLGILAGQEFSDTSSGFRAYSASLVDYFARSFPLEYLSDTVESTLLACYAGFRVTEVPVRMRSREQGRPSTRNLGLAYHFLRLVLVLASMASPRSRRAGKAAA